MHGTRTGQVAERQVLYVFTADLKGDGVGGERKFTPQELEIVVVQEASRVRAWVQDGPLGSPDPVFNICFVVDDIAELLIPWMAERPPVLVREDMEGHDALPWICGVRQAAFRRTAVREVSDTLV